MIQDSKLTADDVRDAVGIIAQISALRNGGDLPGAHRRVRSGASLYPGLSIPGTDDVWSELDRQIRTLMGSDIPVSAMPVDTAPVSAPPVAVSAPPATGGTIHVGHIPAIPTPVSTPPAPVSAPPADVEQDDATLIPGEGLALFGTGHGTITITHRNVSGTTLTGSRPHDGVMEILGSTGQRWNLTRRAPRFFYLGKSAWFAADMERIGWAALALRRAGWHVVYDIDSTGTDGNIAPTKKPSAARYSRIAEVRLAARRQEWVNSAQLLAAAPTSGAPTSAAPVSAAPVQTATETVVWAQPRPAAPVSAAPVKPVRVPAPPRQAKPTITVPNYATMSDDLLLAAVLGGDLTAMAQIRDRLRVNASAATAPVPAVPVATNAPVSSPAAPTPVTIPAHVIVNGMTAEVWFESLAGGRAMREAATSLRQTIMRNVTHRFGEKGDRPAPQVFRNKANQAFRVTVTAPDGTDMATLVDKLITSAQRVNNVGAVREPIAALASTDA